MCRSYRPLTRFEIYVVFMQGLFAYIEIPFVSCIEIYLYIEERKLYRQMHPFYRNCYIGSYIRVCVYYVQYMTCCKIEKWQRGCLFQCSWLCCYGLRICVGARVKWVLLFLFFACRVQASKVNSLWKVNILLFLCYTFVFFF